MRMRVSSLASLSGLRSGVAVDCGEGSRHSSDPRLLWLWPRLAAVAPIQPLAWELPYASGAAPPPPPKKAKKKKTNKKLSEKSQTQAAFLGWSFRSLG